MTLACSNCGTQNADGTTQCTRCGAQLPAQGFGAAPAQQGFGAPPAQQGFGAPAQQQGFGAPAQQAFGAPPAQQGFGAPPGPPPSGYAPPGGYTPPPSGGAGMAGNGKWIAIGCGSLLVLCCCSGIALQLASGGLTSYLQQASTVPEAPLPPVGPVDPGLPFPTSQYAPVGYPPGFPYLPGGAPDPTTTSGTIIVLYTDSPGVIFERFVSAIPDNGWEMMMGTDMSEGGYRFAATRDGRVVRLMAMPEGSGTMLGVHED